MDNLKIFELEENLSKIEALLHNGIVCYDNDSDITELFGYLQNEFNQFNEEFSKFQECIFTFLNN